MQMPKITIPDNIKNYIENSGIKKVLIKHKYLVILALLIMISGSCQLYKINRDLNGMYEYETAQKMVLARNLAEFGPFATKLGPVNNVNPLTGNFSYYLYHPFFDIYVYAFFFKIFGSLVITGRLIGMFLFFAGLICLYYLVSTLWSKNLALWASFFYAFFPISLYYGKFVNLTNVILPLIFLFTLFYYLWLRDNNKKYFYFMVIAFLLGCLTDWYMYFIGAAIIIHYRYILKNKSKDILALILVALSTLIFYLLMNQFLTGSITGVQSQWPINMQYAKSVESLGFFEHVLNTRMDFGLLLQSSFYTTILGHIALCFTFPVILLMLYFLFNYNYFNYLSSPTIYILLISITYFGYGLFNPKTLPDHILLCALLSATAATICGLTILNWPKKFQALFVSVFLLFSSFGTLHLYTMNNTNQDDLIIGKTIPLISKNNEAIAISSPFFSPFTEYYGKRKILYDVYSWERLNYLMNSGKINYFITSIRPFQDYLINNHRSIILPNNFVVFDLNQANFTQPVKHYNITFANNISLINYSFKRLSDDYLLANYDWEKTGGVAGRFLVFVHFEDQNGKYVLGQDHFILNGLADLTKPGPRIAKESYIIKIPDNLKNKTLKVLIGLYSPDNGIRVGVKNVKTVDNRVRLGEI